MHKVGNVCIFVVIQFGNKQYREISHFNMNSNRHDKCQFVLKLIQLSTISNLLPLEVVQKCQYCKLCVLHENSTVV